MPNQAKKISQIRRYKCAKLDTQIYQIRLKSGDHYETHWKENPVILSTPVSDKGIGHTYNEEKQTRSQNTEAERSIIGCETVKIRARTPWASTTRDTYGLTGESSSSMKRRKRSAFSLSDLGIHYASKAIPCENKHEKRLEPPTVWTLKTSKESALAAL